MSAGRSTGCGRRSPREGTPESMRAGAIKDQDRRTRPWRLFETGIGHHWLTAWMIAQEAKHRRSTPHERLDSARRASTRNRGGEYSFR
jgi:hypothetical protein